MTEQSKVKIIVLFFPLSLCIHYKKKQHLSCSICLELWVEQIKYCTTQLRTWGSHLLTTVTAAV